MQLMTIARTPERIELFAQPGIGEVVQMITPNRRGRVKYRASFWPARFYFDTERPVEPSEQVVVIGRDGITLLVTPVTSAQIA
jgi:membrane protein implicated in regulation of membrane protease activity